MRPAPHVDVIGREDELVALDDFLSALPSGPAAFVLVGEAGSGKTTLWRAGIEAARERGFPVRAAGPTEAETRLSFAVPGDLLAGVLEEALIALGRLDEAEAGLGWLDERAHALDRVSALASAARCSGLLAAARGESEFALAELERALGDHDRAAIPFERGRTLLALGAAQRRTKQKSAARETLGAALALFEELGAGKD